jgi:hypothetical protein
MGPASQFLGTAAKLISRLWQHHLAGPKADKLSSQRDGPGRGCWCQARLLEWARKSSMES